MFDEKIKTIKKILYYRDVKLLWRVFTASLKISFISSIRRSQLLNFLVSPKKNITKNADENRIIKYVGFCVFIRKKLGIRDTCLTYSILLCNILRRAGIDAKVNFGAKKREENGNPEDLNLIGHCWVTIGNEKKETAEKLIFCYPEK